MTEKILWHTESRRLLELVPWDRNPRKITETGLKDLKASIDRFGCCQPPVITQDGRLIAGHARLQVLLADDPTGAGMIDCYVPDRELSELEFMELNVRLNKNIAGIFDVEKLNDLFDRDQLLDFGFLENELTLPADIFSDSKIKEREIDETLATENECPKCHYRW